ncbi:DsbA family protein [Candidatus Gracilibacteria bacterium]|nr:DsbA family protein [Candidatus Gracilibacteria bacterium]
MTANAKRIFLYGGLLGGIALIIGVIVAVTAPTLTVMATELSESDHTLGNKESQVVLIEYSDFQCPACRQYSQVISDVVAEFESHMVFTYRYFPLRKIHKNAVTSAQAAEAAGFQGKFWEMYYVLFENQNEWAEMTQDKALETFKGYAKGLGLDTKKFEEDFSSEKAMEKITADEKSANKANLDHTPTFFLNGKEISNPRSLDEFRKVIRDEISKTKK